MPETLKSHESRIRRVFLSSPLRDLEEYRQAAKAAVGKFQQVYDDFTEWSSESGSPLEVSLRRVRSSDLLLLVLAHRYGTEVEELGGKSITHAEVETAIESGIPIRAFFADKNYPWVIQDVDSDPDKLEALKEKVKESCTPAFFRSPESLEIEISRCFLEILISEGLQPEAQMARLIRPSSLKSLSASSSDYFVIGTSPDALPIVLRTTQDHSKLERLGEQILEILTACQMANSKRLTNTIIESATNVAKDKARRRWEAEPTGPNGETVREVFVVQGNSSVRSVCRGILDSLLNEIDVTRTGVVDPMQTRMFLAGDDEAESSRLGFGICKSGQKYLLARLRGEWQVKRPYLTESISLMESVTYVIRLDPARYERGELLSLAETLTQLGASIETYGSHLPLGKLKKTYNSLLKSLNRDNGGVHFIFDKPLQYLKALTTTDLPLQSGHTSTYVAVPTSSLVEVLSLAAEALATRPTEVHGNVKPGNILVTDSGVQLVDGWNVEIGEPTAYASDTWAAPEQVMGEGLAPSSDVYALCKTLAALLGLQLSGELITYRVPRWDAPKDHEFQFIADPIIQYRHNEEIANFSDRHKLRAFFRRGLAGRKEDRIASVAELISQLREIKISELSGSRRITISPSLHTNQLRLEDGTYAACRLMEESVRLDPQIDKKVRRYRPPHDLTQTIMFDPESMLDAFDDD